MSQLAIWLAQWEGIFVLHMYACKKAFRDLRWYISGQSILYANMRFCIPISSTNIREPRMVVCLCNSSAGGQECEDGSITGIFGQPG